MKRILSLILVSLMLLTMLISCNEVDKKDTSIDTDSQITDTSTDNKDVTDEKKELTPTMNTFEYTSEVAYSYYETVNAGRYLGTDISRDDSGNNYRIIKSYEELEELAEYPTAVPERLFENHMILVIRYIGSSSCKYGKDGGFFDLSYDTETKELSVKCHGKYPIECTDDIVVVDNYLIVPRDEQIINNVTSGKINLSNNGIEYGNYEYATFYEIDASKIQVGTVYISKSLAEINEIINKYQLETEERLFDCIEDNSAYILICENACNCKIGYKEFYVDGDIAYITQETMEHKESCKNANVRLDLRRVSFNETENEITKDTMVRVLVEKRVHKKQTNYFEEATKNVSIYNGSIEHDYYTFIENYESTENKIAFPEEYGRYFKIISTNEELQSYIIAPNIDSTLFESSYVLVLNIHESWTYYGEKILGFRNLICDNGQYKINMDHYQSYQNIDFVEAEREHNLTYYLIVPKENIACTEEIKKIEWILTEKKTISTNYFYYNENTPLYNQPTSFIADYDTLIERGFEHIYWKTSYVVLYLPYELNGDFVITEQKIEDGNIYIEIENYLHKDNIHLKNFDSKYFCLYADAEELLISESYKVYITINHIAIPMA